MHDHLALLAVNSQIGEYEGLGSREVPCFTGIFLEVPGHASGVRIDRNDRGEEQIVATLRTADILVPRPAVARADIEEIGCGIVSHGVPRGAASAPLVPFAGPGFGRYFELGVFEGFPGVAGNGIKAPRAFSGFGVVGGEVASDSLFGAARSDNDLAFDYADSGSENRVASGGSVLRRPHELAGFLVESHHTAIQQTRIDAPMVNSHSPVDRSAAETGDVLTGDVRIPAPFGFARPRVQGKHDVPGQNAVEDSVVHERGGFHGSLWSFGGGGPRQ